MSPEPAYARSTAVLWRRVGGEVLLAAPEGTDVDRLSLPASETWMLLERPRTPVEITDALARAFPADGVQIAARVEEILGQLEGRGWVARVDDGEGPTDGDERAAVDG